MSCVRLARRFLGKMLAANWGRIVLISSEVAERPLPHMIAYSVSKASQVNLARGLAELTKGSNVTVNSVLPGPTWTGAYAMISTLQIETSLRVASSSWCPTSSGAFKPESSSMPSDTAALLRPGPRSHASILIPCPPLPHNPLLAEGVEEYMKGFATLKGQSLEEACRLYFKENETTSLLQRYIQPAEVANVVLFLGSQLGSALNGHAQKVEGGLIRHV
jgi:NAD(P)-dependent dehydrogenase (short-subunit alcohol dehydrogenase family)